MTVAGVALWIVWKIAGDYLDGEKRAFAFALMTFIPFFNFHALKFNANTILLPLWAATAFCFLRSYERRSVLWAALAGLFAAGSMLGKYWSVFLLLGLGVAALLDRRRAEYFKSAAPWVTIAVGAAVLAPHVVWLTRTEFTPLTYATAIRSGAGGHPLKSAGNYLIGALAYVALPLICALAAIRPNRVIAADMLWPREQQRRLAAMAFWAPLLLPAILAPVFHFEITSLWTMSAWALLPVVLLSSPRITVPALAARRIVALALALPLVALAASPLIATVIHRQGVPNYASHYRLLAQEVDKAWRATSERPLRLVGSYNNLLYGTVFYFPDRPSTLEIIGPQVTPWTDAARLARDGIALYCPAEDGDCVKALNALAGRGPVGTRRDVEISRRFAGAADKPVRYVIVTLLPRP
jgi:4-amino-4-deoxy-L-arabinose transferase-like glycosyltransferase